MNTAKKVFEILDYILRHPDGVTANVLSKALGMSLPNVYKYLSTLESLGVLMKKDDRKYVGGFKLLEYGSAVLRNLDVREIAHPHLVDLLAKTDQTVHMVVKDGFEGVYVEKLESARSLPMVSRIGMRIPLYCTAVGKSILSYLPKREMEEYFSSVKFEKRTEHTIVDPTELLKELEKTRIKGYAVDREENELGVACVGAPILNHDGYPVAGVSISGVAKRVLPKIEKYGEIIKEYAARISKLLGYREKEDENARHS